MPIHLDRSDAHRHPRLAHLVEGVSFWTQLSLLQMFGPATQDFEHDPIARLKRKHGRALRSWDDGTDTPAEERAHAVLSIREAPAERLPELWQQTQLRWGADASRIWYEAFSATDTSQT
jgi:hypothetical protein